MLTTKKHRVNLECGLDVLEACSTLLNSDAFCKVPILQRFVDAFPQEDPGAAMSATTVTLLKMAVSYLLGRPI